MGQASQGWVTRHVCVVTEVDQRTGRSSLYGVFTDEAGARRDYGDEDPNSRYRVIFDSVPLWSVAAVPATNEGER